MVVPAAIRAGAPRAGGGHSGHGIVSASGQFPCPHGWPQPRWHHVVNPCMHARATRWPTSSRRHMGH
eukprot:5849993-Lingulodinium_polyedra.AAC.1